MPDKHPLDAGGDVAQAAKALLTIIEQLSRELQRERPFSAKISLDSLLDRELGLDSLALAEMTARVERHFQVTLPAQLLARVETPRDLLREILRAHPRGTAPTGEGEIQTLALWEEQSTPEQLQTLPELLDWHVQTHPERLHIHLYLDPERTEQITYADLQQGARALAAGLQAQQLEPGESVAIMLPTCRAYFESFFGILLAGGIPVPIYPPARPSQLEDHLLRHASILNNAQARLLLTFAEAKIVARLLKAQTPMLRGVFTVDELRGSGGSLQQPPASQDDTAFLQYTSGSTGTPKGVILSHANLLTNIRSMGRVIGVRPSDVFVSWLPLYHDMGLIASWLASLYYAIPVVVMSPLLFLTRPQQWLWAIHRHRGTLSAAPNFAYELCLRRIEDRDIDGLDLSCWRAAFNGAEPVNPHTIAQFSERFGAYGFRPETMKPVYGLAESSVGLAIPPTERLPPVDRVRREPLMASGRAIPAPVDDDNALAFVACGQPLPDHQVRIVDGGGRELPERQEGRLEFCGPSSTSGYFRNAEASRRLFSGSWLDSGDRAYLVGGEIYLTGRSKDIIIRAGRNLYPHEVEQAVSEIAGIRKGCVAVFASQDERQATERLVVLAETRERQSDAREELRQAIIDCCLELIGGPPDEVVLAPPHAVLKTSSGKVRRAACRELYERGRIGDAQRALWLQLLRLGAASIGPELRRGWNYGLEWGYAAYCWLLVALLAPPSWLLIALIPSRRWAWGVTRGAARLLLRCLGIPLQLSGLDNLPRQGRAILVANHASYLDGMALTALPGAFQFVAKSELQRSFIARLFLSRLGTQFVERFDQQQSVADAEGLAKLAASGRSLLFFPEGTFHRMPGLHPFHMGAFIAAVEAQAPAVPLTLHGTRSILRDSSWFPRRGAISVRIGAPIAPEGADWAAAVQLRDRARAEILRSCGEPDLGG